MKRKGRRKTKKSLLVDSNPQAQLDAPPPSIFHINDATEGVPFATSNTTNVTLEQHNTFAAQFNLKTAEDVDFELIAKLSPELQAQVIEMAKAEQNERHRYLRCEQDNEHKTLERRDNLAAEASNLKVKEIAKSDKSGKHAIVFIIVFFITSATLLCYVGCNLQAGVLIGAAIIIRYLARNPLMGDTLDKKKEEGD